MDSAGRGHSARALLTSSQAGATPYIDADLRDTAVILTQAVDLLDFTRPVAVTLISIRHALPRADDPHATVARILDAVPPGSYVARSHAGLAPLDPGTRVGAAGIATRTSQQNA